MRALALAVALIACTAAPQATRPTPAPTREPNTVYVSVLLDLSGPRAPSGDPQRDAMRIWLDRTQATAPGSVKLRVKFVDVAGSDVRLLLELRRAVVDDRADAIVIGMPVLFDDAFAQAIATASVPVLLTLPAPEPAPTVGGRWTFVLAPTPDQLARAAVSDIVARGLAAPTLLATDESDAAVVERNAYLAELGRRGLVRPTPIVVPQADGVQRVRTAAAVAKSVVFAGGTAAFTEVVRSFPTTVEPPRVYLSWLTETADLTDLRDRSGLVTWPGSRRLAAALSGPAGARDAFVQAYTDAHGAPSTIAAAAYDALGIIDAAAEDAPAELDAPRLRLRLETRTFAGVVTTYAFTFTRHAPFPAEDIAYLRWNTGRAAPMVAPDPLEDLR